VEPLLDLCPLLFVGGPWLEKKIIKSKKGAFRSCIAKKDVEAEKRKGEGREERGDSETEAKSPNITKLFYCHIFFQQKNKNTYHVKNCKI
jgi:hypothetical protein